MSPKKEMTIRDFAKIAGVSVATVSRSLNNSPLVKQETKQRILQLAEKVGFERNASARGLATSRMDTIGIILPLEYDKFDQHLYYSSLMNDLREDLERSSFDLIVSFATNRFTGKSNILRLINRKKVDGLIILRETLDPEILKFLETKKIPYIFSHYPPANDEIPFDVVYPDHLWGGRLAGEHLASLGYKNILCLCVEGGIHEFDLRVEGFAKALISKGISFSEQNVIYSPFTIKDGFRLVIEHAERVKKADALFAVTDLLAFGALEAVKDLGLRVPDDFAVIGYDDIPLSAELHPPLTSVHQPREEMASETCKRLLEKIKFKDKYKSGVKTVIHPYLVVRESCGAYFRNTSRKER